MSKRIVDNTKPRGILRRPLDFYAALIIFFVGIYGFLDPTWPEKYDTLTFWILTVEDVYLASASLAIMVALAMQTCKSYPPQAVVLEMFGWLFISAAAGGIALTAAWLPTSAFDQDSALIDFAWVIMWAGLSAASLVRWWAMRRQIKEGAVK